MTKPIRTVLAAPLLAALLPGQNPTGELKRWHTITLTFDGPFTSETATPNPFTDYRLDVTFRRPGQSGRVYRGYWAADGNAADSGATSGNKWRVHFVPDAPGTWLWTASFVTGPKVAAGGTGTATAFDGATGSFDVQATDKQPPDFRALGLMVYDGGRFPRFAGTGQPFLEIGVNSPENVFAYEDIDGTFDRGGGLPNFLHRFAPHVPDFARLGGGPTWRGGLGQGLLGAISYLSEQRMNSMFVLALGAWGDGDDVWPWIDVDHPHRYDCSKLDQWQRVLDHATQRGVHVQFTLTETENESFFEIFEGGTSAFADSRRIYHREMVARFGHVLALTWNLGEEIGWDPGAGSPSPYRFPTTDAQRRAFAAHLRALDPYDHPIIVHSYHHVRSGQTHQVLHPLSDPTNPARDIAGASLQGPYDAHRSVLAPSNDPATNNHAQARFWVERSIAAGHPWIVCAHEQMPSIWGTVPDGNSRDPNHDFTRKDALWGTLMAGGAGVQHYFGYGFRSTSGDDINAESFHTRANLWAQSAIAYDFFVDHLPFTDMLCFDELVGDPLAYCLADPGRVYAVYLRFGGTTSLDLGGATTAFDVRWYDPRNGGALQSGPVTTVVGPGVVSLGAPPKDVSSDWVALVRDTGRLPGTGCAGSGSPTITPELRIGRTVHIALPARGAAFLPLIGIGIPPRPPYDLGAPIVCGSTPCTIAIDPMIGVPGRTLDLPVPDDPNLVGIDFRFQGFWLDQNRACLDVSGALELAPRR